MSSGTLCTVVVAVIAPSGHMAQDRECNLGQVRSGQVRSLLCGGAYSLASNKGERAQGGSKQSGSIVLQFCIHWGADGDVVFNLLGLLSFHL